MSTSKSADLDIKAQAIQKLIYVRIGGVCTPSPGVTDLCLHALPTLFAAALQYVQLQMMGYDYSWASFHVVEVSWLRPTTFMPLHATCVTFSQVMSQPWFGHRRVGYLAASLSFTSETDVILLTTHLFRKVLYVLSSVHSD